MICFVQKDIVNICKYKMTYNRELLFSAQRSFTINENSLRSPHRVLVNVSVAEH